MLEDLQSELRMEKKSIILFTKDNKIDWSFIPSKVTDQEFKYQIHRHQWMLPKSKSLSHKS